DASRVHLDGADVDAHALRAGFRRVRFDRIFGLRRIRSATGTGGAPAVDEHDGSLNGDPRRPDVDEAAGSLERQLHAGLDDDVETRLQMDLHAGVDGVLHRDLLELAHANGECRRAVDLIVAVALDVLVALLAHRLTHRLLDRHVVL